MGLKGGGHNGILEHILHKLIQHANIDYNKSMCTPKTYYLHLCCLLLRNTQSFQNSRVRMPTSIFSQLYPDNTRITGVMITQPM